MPSLLPGMPTALPSPWRWLLDLRDQLGPALEVLAPSGDLLLPATRGDVSERLRRLLKSPPPGVAALLGAGDPARIARVITVNGLRVLVMGFHGHDEPNARHHLVLAERADAGRESSRRADLARTAAWLTRALTSTARTSIRDWHQITVLHKLLQATIGQGAQSAVVRAYVDALAIWCDIETRAYLANHADRYVLDVALAGADRTRAPRTLPADAVTAIRSRRRLPPIEAGYYGFTGGPDIIAAPIRIAGQAPWLLVYSGRFDGPDEERLGLFEDMLVPALHTAAEVEASRLVWTMMQPLADRSLAPADAAARALSELERVALASAALRVSAGSQVLLDLGTPPPAGPRGSAWPPHAVHRVPLPIKARGDAVLTLWRPPDRPFTYRETRLVDTGGAMLAAWAGMVAVHPPPAAETLTGAQDRRRTTAVSGHVSLLVVMPEPVDTAPDIRESWVTDLRQQLRASDIVAMVASGDISVLLPSTGTSEAQGVASRLSRLFSHRTALALLDGAAIGVVSTRGDTSGTLRT